LRCGHETVANCEAQREFRERGVPSGLANEIYLDVYERWASFEPQVRTLQQRLFDAYAAEVKRVSGNDDGIITAAQADIDTPTDGFADNARLFLPPTVFNRFAVTREINDGLLAPRFAPSQRAWVLSGVRVAVDPTVDASTGRDADATCGLFCSPLGPGPGTIRSSNIRKIRPTRACDLAHTPRISGIRFPGSSFSSITTLIGFA